MAWNNSFSANVVKPAYPQYELIDLTADIELVWPTESMEGAQYVAALIDVNPSILGLNITMPSAVQGTPGVSALFVNTGCYEFTLLDNDGGQIAIFDCGESWLVSVIDNTTVAGEWSAIQIGATTSYAQSAALAGNGLQALLTKLQTTITVRSTAANGPIAIADRATGIIWTGAAGTLTLDARTTLTEKWWAIVSNDGTATLTVATTGGDTINGAANITLPPSPATGQVYSCLIVASASEFNTFLGVPTPTPIGAGGTGADNAGDALTNLGGSGIGIAIFTAPSAAAILALLGISQSLLTEDTIAVSQGVSPGDSGTVYVCTAALTLTLPLADTVDTAFFIAGYAQGGDVTIAPNVVDSVDGGAAGVSLLVPQGSSFLLVTDAGAPGNWWPLFLDIPSDPDPAVWAVAAGTADAITAAYAPPNTVLSDGMLLGFRASGPNLTTTPTFAPDGLTAHPIVRLGGVALRPGDIALNLAECLVRYNLVNTRWELFNPATIQVPWAAAGGTVDIITATYLPANAALYDGMELGFRAFGANTAASPTFSPDGLAAHPMTKRGGSTLVAGDIPAALAECLVRYNLANTRWELLNPASSPTSTALAGSFTGLQIVNNGVSPNTTANVTANAVAVTNGTSAYNLLGVSLAIDISTVGANGLDSGVVNPSTFYSVWVIYNPTTATTAGLFSTSATTPTLPAGYTFSARVGWMRTSAASILLRTRQLGRRVQYTSPPLPVLGTGGAGDVVVPTYAAISTTTFVPSTAVSIICAIAAQGVNGAAIAAPNGSYGSWISSVNPPPVVVNSEATTQTVATFEFLLESANVYWASQGASNLLYCLGWTDSL